MALVTKKNAKVGLEVFACVDDRPFDGYSCNKAIITEVHKDHYIYKDIELDIDIWGFYDDDVSTSSVAVFTTEKEAKRWLNI